MLWTLLEAHKNTVGLLSSFWIALTSLHLCGGTSFLTLLLYFYFFLVEFVQLISNSIVSSCPLQTVLLLSLECICVLPKKHLHLLLFAFLYISSSSQYSSSSFCIYLPPCVFSNWVLPCLKQLVSSLLTNLMCLIFASVL